MLGKPTTVGDFIASYMANINNTNVQAKEEQWYAWQSQRNCIHLDSSSPSQPRPRSAPVHRLRQYTQRKMLQPINQLFVIYLSESHLQYVIFTFISSLIGNNMLFSGVADLADQLLGVCVRKFAVMFSNCYWVFFHRIAETISSERHNCSSSQGTSRRVNICHRQYVSYTSNVRTEIQVRNSMTLC